MSPFDRAWELAKAFYVDKDDPNAAWYSPHPHWDMGETRLAQSMKEKTPLKGDPGALYRVGLNLANPYFRFSDWDADPEKGNSVEMDEDERIKRIIDTIVHEEGHHAIMEPLEREAWEDFRSAKDENVFAHHFLPSRQTKEHGAMIVEGIPLNRHMETLRRRGYLF